MVSTNPLHDTMFVILNCCFLFTSTKPVMAITIADIIKLVQHQGILNRKDVKSWTVLTHAAFINQKKMLRVEQIYSQIIFGLSVMCC